MVNVCAYFLLWAELKMHLEQECSSLLVQSFFLKSSHSHRQPRQLVPLVHEYIPLFLQSRAD